MKRPYSFSFNPIFDRMNQSVSTGHAFNPADFDQLMSDELDQEFVDIRHHVYSNDWLPERAALFVPENYEPNYAYPLIVWLHSEGSSERQLLELMPKISDRNYIGVSLRGTIPDQNSLPGHYRWGQSAAQRYSSAVEIENLIREIRERYHIHPSRVHLAGFGNGATMALSIAFSHPGRYAGVAALCGLWPKDFTPLANFRDLRETRVLLGAGAHDPLASEVAVRRAGHLLHAAGLDPTIRVYDAGRELTPAMLGDVDHWVMSGIASAYIVK